jgi:hypothetical protein
MVKIDLTDSNTITRVHNNHEKNGYQMANCKFNEIDDQDNQKANIIENILRRTALSH